MVGPAATRVVAVLTRAPAAGGKRRLFAELGRPPDASLLEALLLDTLDGVADARWRRIVVVEPADACPGVAASVGAGLTVIPQATGPLGDRMRLTMAALLARGVRSVVLIGSDLPTISAALVADAFDALDEQPLGLVLGPATDGGFYLIGGTQAPPGLDGIPWGGPSVLRDTVGVIERAGIPVRLLGPLGDVDSVADLRRVVALESGTGDESSARRTRRWARANLVS